MLRSLMLQQVMKPYHAFSILNTGQYIIFKKETTRDRTFCIASRFGSVWTDISATWQYIDRHSVCQIPTGMSLYRLFC